MRRYDLYQHPTKGLKVVKDGFSWPGFWFGTLWLLSKGLFVAALGVFVLVGILGAVTESDFLHLLVAFGVALAIGTLGNASWGAKLSKRGYLHLGKVEAANRDQALAHGAVEALKAAA
jgi:hypothetical protein